MLKYKRVSLKLSGEALGGRQETIDFSKAEAVAAQLAALHAMGVEIGVTLGGGNIWRGRSSGNMDRNRADQMGMLATVINSLALQDCLLKLGVPCRVMSSVDMPRMADSYSSRGAQAALSAGEIVIFAGGSGLPFFSTDTAAALKAAEIGADVMLLAKNVDAIYSADPKEDTNAIRYARLSYDQVLAKNLKAMDLTAITLCKEQHIPIVAFAMDAGKNILKAVLGEAVGTLIDEAGE
ncbi:MAG: UMP kinase [Candidatus Pelethousia sp.]|nr:UMP kinase [Candidatus Pelethousia sp.]